MMIEVILKRFDDPDVVTTFEKGRFETVTEMRAGDVFHVPAEPHDSWVVGDEPYVSLHFLGAGKYAK